MNENNPKVKVFTVTYNSRNHIENFIKSFNKYFPNSIEILIADNGSSDGTIEYIHKEFSNDKQIKLFKMKSNLGYGKAINELFKLCSDDFDYLLVANPDLIFIENILEPIFEELSKKNMKNIGIVGPKILNLDGSTYPSARKQPSLFYGIGHAVLSGVWPKNPWTKKYLNLQNNINSRKVGWLSGACLLIRVDIFKKVKGFSEKYFMYLEDVDLAKRFDDLGWKSLYVPKTKIIHDQGHSANKFKKNTVISHHESMKIFLNDKYSKKWQKPLRILLSFSLEKRKNLIIRKQGL